MTKIIARCKYLHNIFYNSGCKFWRIAKTDERKVNGGMPSYADMQFDSVEHMYTHVTRFLSAAPLTKPFSEFSQYSLNCEGHKQDIGKIFAAFIP